MMSEEKRDEGLAAAKALSKPWIVMSKQVS